MIGRILAIMTVAVIALAVPTTQLRVGPIEQSCCCPDPDHCKCSDHDPDQSQPSMRRCHASDFALAAPELPIATVRTTLDVSPILTASILAIGDPARPHPAPSPRRPDAPS